MLLETRKEYTQDIVFGIAFLVLAVLSGWRMLIYFDPNGGGKVITAFYGLILCCSSLRSIWFFIPKSLLEGSYTPIPTTAFISPLWQGAFVSEILVSIGSLSLYGVFILIICYWAHMLRKVEHAEESTQLSAAQRSLARYPRAPKPKRGPMYNFVLIMGFLLALEVLNAIFFLMQGYNSEGMILFDSILITVISVVAMIEISIFSHRIRVVLMNIGVINASSTRPQVRRILAITIAANIFFMWRVITEAVMTGIFLFLWKEHGSLSVAFTSRHWDLYINIKHWTEVVVLVLDLLISTAIKSPSTTAPPMTTSAASANPRIRRRDYQKVTEMKTKETRPQTEETPLI